MEDTHKKEAIEAALRQIEKMFGKGAVMRLGERGVVKKVDTISTGSLTLDIALGIGGIPRGRVTEIFGPEASGKTTLGLHILAEAQKQGGVGAFIDAEHALDPTYAKNLGVNIEDLLVSQPDTGEEALEIAETLTRSGAVDVIIVDSVAALVPRAEIEGDMGDSHLGLQARLMSQAMRKLTSVVSKTNVGIVFMNQIRYKIGIMFGDPTTTPGGLALKFHSSVRLRIVSASRIKKGNEVVGNRVIIRVVKNKLAPPFQEAEFDIIYGKGISKEEELIALGVKYNLIEKSGSWFSIEGEKIGQGKDSVIQYLENSPSLKEKLEKEIRIKANLIKKEEK
jgi:recombination protein RecA